MKIFKLVAYSSVHLIVFQILTRHHNGHFPRINNQQSGSIQINIIAKRIDSTAADVNVNVAEDWRNQEMSKDPSEY